MRTRHRTKAVALPRRKTHFTRFHKRIAIIICILIAILSLILLFNVTSSAKNTYTAETYYSNVYVNSGDTLWDIATENYSVEYGDFDDFLDDIRTLNHLSNDNIHSGEYIVVPICK